MQNIRESWQDGIGNVQGWAGYIKMRKLRELKPKLKEWDQNEFGNNKMVALTNKLNELDLVAEQNPFRKRG